MAHLKITTALSVVLVTALATSNIAQAQTSKRNKVGASNVTHAVTPDRNRPQIERPKAKPRFNWGKLWKTRESKEITAPGIDGSCRTTAEASLEISDQGVANAGDTMNRMSCRVSLDKPGSTYQVSVLTDHGASETFECAAGPVRDTRRYTRRADQINQAEDSALEESAETDRDEWQFTASRRLQTVAVRCRIPAGGIVREVIVTDCGLNTCATGA